MLRLKKKKELVEDHLDNTEKIYFQNQRAAEQNKFKV